MQLATDIGGTFTDLVYVAPDGRVQFAKSSSTPGDFSEGVMAVIAKSGLPLAEARRFIHGSTVVINALVQRRGARTGLVTTRGFRDILGIGRANRPDMYNMRFAKQAPYVPREWRFEVTERLDHRGNVVQPLAEDELTLVAEAARREGLEALAVCFLHSYANPAHEQRCAAVLQELLPGVAVTASHDITKEWREYERTNTAVLNAYVQPVVGAYLSGLQQKLEDSGLRVGPQIMKSNGGTATFAVARQQPIHLVESGPVAGVVGAAAIGRLMGLDNVITLDIGGTTAKSSLVQGGQVRMTTDYRVERDAYSPGYPIKVPVVDIVEIGAGGGSIAYIDDGGAIQVGPESAGASPGPACYAQGGLLPTVTDANLVVGRLNPANFLGGDLPLHPEHARAALKPLADAFSMSVEDIALGVLRVANASMMNAIRLVSVRRGHDPRDFTLIAFGGGGPLHAAALARELRIGQVVIPRAPGTFSALGMLATRPIQDFVRTRVTPSSDETWAHVRNMFADMEEEAKDFMAAAGFAPDKLRMRHRLDARYRGQEHTVQVPVDNWDRAEVEARFHALHEQAYTFRLDSAVEFVNFHVSAVYGDQPVDIRALAPGPADADQQLQDAGQGSRAGGQGSRNPEPKERRLVLFEETGARDTPVYDRDSLPVAQTVAGPAVIEEATSTTIVYPGQSARVDELGNIVIETEV